MDQLFEKNGVFEFDNQQLRSKIRDIASSLLSKYRSGQLEQYFKDVNFENFEKQYQYAWFYRILVEDLGIEWLKQLDIYICLSKYGDDAFAFDTDLAKNNGFFEMDEKHIIKKASIIIAYSSDIDYYGVIMHELKHLYDRTLFLNIWQGDCTYSLSHRMGYDINLFNLDTNVEDLPINDIHSIITESMSNFSEQHAFMEIINAQMEDFFKNKRKFLNPFLKKEDFFMKSSAELYNIYILENLLKKIKDLNSDKKEQYWNNYKDVFKEAYFNFNNFSQVLSYIFKKIHKIVNHSRNLFNFYWDKFHIEELYKLNEDAKLQMIKGRRRYTNRQIH